jgi:hypothetical protein
MGLSRQRLRSEIRRQIRAGLQRDPSWRTANHRKRARMVKEIFQKIWDSASDKESLAQGVDWARERNSNGPV